MPAVLRLSMVTNTGSFFEITCKHRLLLDSHLQGNRNGIDSLAFLYTRSMQSNSFTLLLQIQWEISVSLFPCLHTFLRNFRCTEYCICSVRKSAECKYSAWSIWSIPYGILRVIGVYSDDRGLSRSTHLTSYARYRVSRTGCSIHTYARPVT